MFHMPILGEFECAEGIVENAEEQQRTRRNVRVWLSVAEMKAAPDLPDPQLDRYVRSVVLAVVVRANKLENLSKSDQSEWSRATRPHTNARCLASP